MRKADSVWGKNGGQEPNKKKRYKQTRGKKKLDRLGMPGGAGGSSVLCAM